MRSRTRFSGRARIRVFGPDGEIKAERVVKNLITQVGDQVYMELGSAAASPNAPTGMRLGTGNTAVAKTGAGAAIVTYVSGSAKVLDGTPTSELDGSARKITYETTWDAGEGTSEDIAEVVLTNETAPLTDDGGSAANTVARALVSPTVDKAAGDTMVVTWEHTGEGA